MHNHIVRLHGKRDIRIETEETPVPGPGEVVLQMAVGGICGSDLHYYQDGGFGPVLIREPIVSGHEASGFVAVRGQDVTFPPVGALVAVNPSQPCGKCRYCELGQPIHCLDMRFMGSAMRMPHEQGMFRNMLVVPAQQCFPGTEGISAAEAACAEPLAVCLHAVAQAGDLSRARILVTGAGPIGLLTMAAARHAGAAEIVATDLADAALSRAPDTGATSTVNVARDPQQLARYEEGKGYFDVVFDCSAAAPALRSAFATVRPRGTIVQVGVTGDIAIPLNLLVGKEVVWRGSQRFDQEFGQAIDLISSRTIDVRPIISHSFPLEKALEAFEQAGDRSSACKVQIELGAQATSLEFCMKHTWRWFGPVDKVTVRDAAQAGAEGIVSALHHIPTGSVWPVDEIHRRHEEIKAGGLVWDIVESVPVSEDIKTQTGDWREHIAAWQETLRRLGATGIRTVCYNFMPVLDWTRTDLRWETRHGAKAMRFDLAEFIAFDIHILKRPGAEADYPESLRDDAAQRFAKMPDEKISALGRNIGAGLPGSADGYTLDQLLEKLRSYQGIDRLRLQSNLIDFLSQVVPVAEEVGINICAHGDDPPWPLLGLPRILSTEADYAHMLSKVDARANGVTLCTGSLGARADNDLPKIAERFADRIHFVHLRNVTRDADTLPCSFFEDEHLEGGTDMVAVLATLLREEKRRRDDGREDHRIAMRPDHGQEILDDLTRGAQPGYPAIGRLKGLAELRGIERALLHPQFGLN